MKTRASKFVPYSLSAPGGGEGVQQFLLRGHFAITLLIVGLDDLWKTDRIQNQDIRHETNEAIRR